jgi:UDP:flavonoid glycosyltransferase YjiC (YdhE family)
VGRRAILLTADGGDDSGREDVLRLGYMPYSSVFSHAAAVVHHAGMGTLAQALAAGRPQLMLPLAFDQPDNADRAARLGVGRVLRYAEADPRRLARQLETLLADAGCERSARELSRCVLEEDGAARAAGELARLLQA